MLSAGHVNSSLKPIQLLVDFNRHQFDLPHWPAIRTGGVTVLTLPREPKPAAADHALLGDADVYQPAGELFNNGAIWPFDLEWGQ